MKSAHIPERIQLRRTKGWRKPNNTVVVSRPSHWGNPFTLAMARRLHPKETERQLANRIVRAYACLIDGEIVEQLERELKGKNLACWCPKWKCDQCGDVPDTGFSKLVGHGCCCGGEYQRVPCHADVLLFAANRR